MDLFKTYREDFRLNLKLALPIMGAQLGQVTVNIADNIMVGRLGAAPLASISVSIAILIIFMVVGMGISFALPPLVSEADGANDRRGIPSLFSHSLLINLAFAVLSCVLIVTFIPHMDILGHDKEVIELAKPYLLISAWALIPFMFFQTLRCYADGLSNTVISMKAIIIGNVVNVVLNYVLIFGHWGFPSLGVAGAAWASMAARLVMICVVLYLIFGRRRLWIHMRRSLRFRFQMPVVRRLISLGVPTSLQMFFEVSAFSGAALLMGMLGKNEQAAHQITINMASTTFLIATGVGMASTIRVGNRLGERNFVGARNAGLAAVLQIVLFMLTTALIFVVFRHYLPQLYIGDDVVLPIASYLLLFAALFQIPDGVQVVAVSALRGLQDVTVPTLICFIAYWIFGLPLSYAMAFHWGFGPAGIWIGLVVGLSIAATLLTIRFHKKTVLLSRP